MIGVAIGAIGTVGTVAAGATGGAVGTIGVIGAIGVVDAAGVVTVGTPPGAPGRVITTVTGETAGDEGAGVGAAAPADAAVGPLDAGAEGVAPVAPAEGAGVLTLYAGDDGETSAETVTGPEVGWMACEPHERSG
jgi:hypothetical protein